MNIPLAYSSTGSKTVALDVWGQPGTIAQTDTDTQANYITIATNPTAPGNLSTKTLSLSTASQGTSPKLAAGATDNTGGNIVANGTSVIRYTTSTPVNSANITDANTATTGTLTAYISGTASGNVTFTTSGNTVGTVGNLQIIEDADAHTAISASTYPTGFYKVFSSRITAPISGISTGYNDFLLSHSVSGNTNVTGFVKDDMTSVPLVVQGGATIAEGTAGTYRYISGVPYYNTGSPTVVISGLAVANLVGQTYRDTSTPIQFTTGTLAESTTGSIIATQTKTYTQIDGSPSMLTSGIPNADTGVGSDYTMGSITLSINGSARAVGYLDAQMFNVNGSSTIVDLTDQYIQIYSAAISGIDEGNIDVSASLGTVYTDDGVRVTGFGSASDTPAFNGATNYYTGNAWSGAETVAGTSEAIVRWGSIKHFTTDLSSGYLPTGPDLNTGRSGTQYFTFAFRRATVANFDIAITSTTGISGLWIAAPGTQIDDTSTLNGWLDCSIQYNGAGIPGADTGNGGNGSNGCALTGADVVPIGSALAGSYTMTLGEENMSNATGNVVLVRIALASGETVSAVSIGVAI